MIGKTNAEFKLMGSDLAWKHSVEVIADEGTPNILGIDFWLDHRAAMMDLAGKQIHLQHPSGVQVAIPFTTSRPCTPVPVAAVARADNHPRMVVRMPYTAVLPPGQPLMLEVLIAARHFNKANSWNWEPVNTTAVHEDNAMLKLTSHSVISAVWEAHQESPVLQQVMLNCSEKDVLLMQGEVMGYVEQTLEAKSMLNVLQNAVSTKMVSTVDHPSVHIGYLR